MLTVKKLNEICAALPKEVKAALQPTFENIEFETGLIDKIKSDKYFAMNRVMQKEYRQMSQTYQQDIKLVLWAMRQNETSSAEELMNMLKEFKQ